MSSKEDSLYHIQHVVKKRLDSISNNKTISDNNKKLIDGFIQTCTAKGLSGHRLLFYLSRLTKILEFNGKDMDQWNRDDVEKVMARVESSGYKAWTRENFKVTLKIFFKWYYKVENGDPLPTLVRWLTNQSPPNKLVRDDLLTPEEVKKMMDCTNNLMWKALLATLFESGTRAGELRAMKLRDIKFTETEVQIQITGGKMAKKMRDRFVFLYQSYDILRSWIDNHPFKNDPNHYVWINTSAKNHGEVLQHRHLDITLKRLAVNAGLNKRVFAHLFRHSRAYIWHRDLGQAVAQKALGHAPDSDMSRTYQHFTSDNVRDALRKQHGLKKKEELTPEDFVCGRCKHPNGIGSTSCSVCGLPLSQLAAAKIKKEEEKKKDTYEKLEKLANMIENSPELMKIISSDEWQDKQAKKLKS